VWASTRASVAGRATSRGILVVNSPEGNTIAPRALPLALMFASSQPYPPGPSLSTMAGGLGAQKPMWA